MSSSSSSSFAVDVFFCFVNNNNNNNDHHHHHHPSCSADRLRKVLVACISTSTPKLTLLLDAQRTLSFFQSSGGVVFIPRIDAMVSKIVRFTRVNLEVHSSTYNRLIAAAVKQCCAEK